MVNGLWNGPSKVSPELILTERRYGGKEPVLGVEDVIAKIVIGESMVLARSGTGDGIDHLRQTADQTQHRSCW